MAQPEQKFITNRSLAIDAVLTVIIFIFFFKILESHVPTTDTKWIYIGAAYCSSCLTALFWLVLQMFRTVLGFQRAPKK
ncbi:MAG: hypothetical protein KGJ37_01025 [Verrucomicrobiota bacterium]|nr:hypothetical protein [Verrucomicrobiota bacterium]